LTGVTVKVPPLQIVAVWLGITGFGFMVTVTVNVAPTQLPAAPDVGVTVYVAVTGALVLLVSVPVIDAPLPAAPPVKPTPAGAPHAYVVPAGTMVTGGALTGVTVKVPPLQIVAVWLGITGFGFMVTVTVNVAPTQLPAAPDVGVTVYVAVTGALVLLVSVPVIDAPLPAAPPLKPAPAGAPHAYVVPAGTMVTGGASTGVTVKLPPLQIVAV
jgi:hypothetical protein